MPIQGFRVMPTNSAEWDRFFRQVPVVPDPQSVGADELKADAVATVNVQDEAITTAKVAAKAITNDRAADMPGLSVKTRGTDTDGEPGETLAATDNTFLARRGTQLVFDPLVDGDIPSTLARTSYVDSGDASVTSAFQAADTALQTAILALTDPFPQYQTQTEGDARYVQLANVLNASTTFDPPSINAAAVTTTTVTVTGAAVGDYAQASHSDSATANADKVELNAKVTAANTVTVYLRNNHTAAVDLASGTLKVRVWKQ